MTISQHCVSNANGIGRDPAEITRRTSVLCTEQIHRKIPYLYVVVCIVWYRTYLRGDLSHQQEQVGTSREVGKANVFEKKLDKLDL